MRTSDLRVALLGIHAEFLRSLMEEEQYACYPNCLVNLTWNFVHCEMNETLNWQFLWHTPLEWNNIICISWLQVHVCED